MIKEVYATPVTQNLIFARIRHTCRNAHATLKLTLAGIDIGISVDTGRARTAADLLWLIARRGTLKLLTDDVCAGDARVSDGSGVAKVRIDADECSGATSCLDAVEDDVAFALLCVF